MIIMHVHTSHSFSSLKVNWCHKIIKAKWIMQITNKWFIAIWEFLVYRYSLSSIQCKINQNKIELKLCNIFILIVELVILTNNINVIHFVFKPTFIYNNAKQLEIYIYFGWKIIPIRHSRSLYQSKGAPIEGGINWKI
jgi:hypothetical protein